MNDYPERGRLPCGGEIWKVHRPRLPNCGYAHYAIICGMDRTKVYLNFMATDGNPERDDDLLIDSRDPEFVTTGLDHSTHILRNHYYAIELSKFKADFCAKLKKGALQTKILDWTGWDESEWL